MCAESVDCALSRIVTARRRRCRSPPPREHAAMARTNRLPFLALGACAAIAAVSRARLPKPRPQVSARSPRRRDHPRRAHSLDDGDHHRCAPLGCLGMSSSRWGSAARLVQLRPPRQRGIPSAETIARRCQHLHVGDRIPSEPIDKAWFDVVVVEHERVLVLRAPLTVPGGRPFDPRAGRPRGSATAPGVRARAR